MRAWHVAVGVAALAAMAALSYVRDREQRRQIENLTRELREARHVGDREPQTKFIYVTPPSMARPEAVTSGANRLPTDSDSRPPPTDQQRAALVEANRVADTAIARGRLEMDDVRALQRELTIADQPERAAEIGQRLVVAINRDQLRPADATVFRRLFEPGEP